MKTLNDHYILYDAECPMCKMYTNVFVQTGMLDANGREAYQHINAAACPMVDRQRAANEIALVNRQTGEVTYGIKSLFKIIGNAAPVFKPLFTFAPFVWFMSKVYAFISYNRRVIIPAACDRSGIQPTFKLKYHIAYLVFTWAVTSYILTFYAGLLQGIMPVGNLYREALICGGQIIFQGMVISIIAKDKKWDYLGNMMTISFAGGLLLLLMLPAAKVMGAHPVSYAGYFIAVAGLMFLEHIRRSKLLNIGWALTITWSIYRAAILAVILFL
ncbi:DCC1-like thiol-disulfide oxidoreductase family protein [Mucilaginibacter lutimaris]|uniref:DCC1-like thiol-disulfide oxidoreductase family protein n=1 Tax=Mucilaginibacter lutimaris TaxID=931629 RepID=A0ABW2ZIE2_9SPHI